MGKTVQELLESERTEHRYNMIQKVLPYFEKYAKESDSIPIIVGGDILVLFWMVLKNNNGL